MEIESVRLDRSVLARYLGSIGDLCDAQGHQSGRYIPVLADFSAQLVT